MFRLKISWGLAVCLALFVAEAGNAAPRAGGFPVPRGEASWLDPETLWARAWNWLIDPDVSPKHGSMIDPDGGPKHGWEADPGGATGARSKRGPVPVIGPGHSH